MKTKRIKTVKMNFQTPITFEVNGQLLSHEEANMFLELHDREPVFTSNCDLFLALRKLVKKTPWYELDLARQILSNPKEKAYLKAFLIDYHVGQ
jgi:hypothetical protein